MAKIRYTLHEHRARRAGLHYDLRLQKGNDAYSFALPKAHIPDGENVFLAVLSHIDHKDLSVLSFSGTIEDGNYGAGNLSIIETGTYEIIEWPNDDKKIVFRVPKQYSTRQFLEGEYYLVETFKKRGNYVFGKKK